MRKPKLLILGNMRHGKDTFAEILRDRFGMTFQSSSQSAADIFIYDELKEKFGYKTPEECFEDRGNHRPLWHQMIKDYNKDDKARLAKGILENNDCYVGMRDREEIAECMKQGLFDLIIWVDASGRLPLEGSDSFNIDMNCADIILENNGTFEEFEQKAIRLGKMLFNEEPRMKISEINPTGGFLAFCKNAILDGMDEDEIDIDEFDRPMYELQEYVFIHEWPEIKDDEGNLESLDLENHEILSINDYGMTIIAGGDWQDPHKVQIIFDGEKVYAASCEKCEFKHGLSDEEFFKTLGFVYQD